MKFLIIFKFIVAIFHFSLILQWILKRDVSIFINIKNEIMAISI